MKKELSSLLVSESDLASEAIVSVLQGIIQIGKESGAVIPTAAFMRLDRNSKILAFLLGLRAASALGVIQKPEASVEEIARVVGFDFKSVGEYVSRLKHNFLSRGTNGYSIPPEKIHLACDQIKICRDKGKE
jgi:hypothetical protein